MHKKSEVQLLLGALFMLLFWLAACSAEPQPDTATTLPAPPERVTTTNVQPTLTAVTPADPITPPPTGYPAISEPAPTTQPADYPAIELTAVPYPPPNADQGTPGSESVYAPIIGSTAPTATPLPSPTPSPVPTLDFVALQSQLQQEGQDLAFVKIGFHVTLPEDRDLLDEWMQQQDAAGVPFFLKTVDNAEPLFRAQELMKSSGVPHTLVYRATGGVPEYNLPPIEAAQLHWQTHRDIFPPELDPSLVWIETLNEVDRTRAEWFGQFALETARLAQADGFRWAAFGWAAGEPEPEQWQTPAMLKFLRLAGENPEQLAIALHEYSYITDDIGHEYPYKMGRFQELFRIVDQQGIPRPTVLITEWGWEYADIPPVDQAMRDLAWASRLYAAYPQVKGAAIWNLGIGCCFDDISEQTQQLIGPLTEYSLNNYFAVPQGVTAVDPAAYRP